MTDSSANLSNTANDNPAKPQPATLMHAMAENGITIRAEFVPFSQSRNKAEKRKTLNWRVTLVFKNRDIMTTDYSAGMAHGKAYSAKGLGIPNSLMRDEAMTHEAETGRAYYDGASWKHGPKIEPKAPDVLHSLLSDSDVLEYANFESWAREFGYDEDSRKGEALYKACLEIALKLRAGLGESVLSALKEAAQDY